MDKKQQDNRFKRDARFASVKHRGGNKMDERFKKTLLSGRFNQKSVNKYGQIEEDSSTVNVLKDQFDMTPKEVEEMKKKLDEQQEGSEHEDMEIEKKGVEENASEEDEEVEMEPGVMESFKEEERIPKGQCTRRVGIVGCDWDDLSAQELFALLSANLPPTGKLLSVGIYPSQFGIERMAREEEEGLPKDLWKGNVEEVVEVIEDKNLLDPNYKPVFTVASDDKITEVNPILEVKDEEMKSDSEEDNDEDLGLRPIAQEMKTASSGEKNPIKFMDREKLGVYDNERKKYYFGVATFDSAQTANDVYEMVDGNDLEFCEFNLDLRFLPDDLELPYEATDYCDKLEKLISREGRTRKGHSHIMWDSNDNRRIIALNKNWMDEDEADVLAHEEMYKEYIEHSSDYENSNETSEEGDNQMSEDEEGNDNGEETESAQQKVQNKKKIKKESSSNDSEDSSKSDESNEESDERPKKESKPIKKFSSLLEPTKKSKKHKDESDVIRKKYEILLGENIGEEGENAEGEHVMKFYTDAEVEKPKKDLKKERREKEKQKEELELLMMDDLQENEEKKKGKRLEETEDSKKPKRKDKLKKKSKKEKMDTGFKIDTTDDRFKKVLNSNDFEIDVTNPEYMATRGMKELVKEKHKAFDKKNKEFKKQTKKEDK
ncbi:hypothetical protein EIN_032050 [Entamoeba invadens IP1]|uniref:Uncharacterized protein n=1 Tax=Entamoeba invadens IP1 TaxID=370355 RepID=A0A0A1TYA3_ENTIV|nr:hypothetical protein EIN_032050 [Entamoeba invadens IP1]ELP86454.1 hypothetical protein EIN_032050 [Entamoeba invadens IP1]|eukprot:XP_004185800.1 hypothetical protein EIN_032050 [Entamoeba invadens IP1]